MLLFFLLLTITAHNHFAAAFKSIGDQSIFDNSKDKLLYHATESQIESPLAIIDKHSADFLSKNLDQTESVLALPSIAQPFMGKVHPNIVLLPRNVDETPAPVCLKDSLKDELGFLSVLMKLYLESLAERFNGIEPILDNDAVCDIDNDRTNQRLIVVYKSINMASYRNLSKNSALKVINGVKLRIMEHGSEFLGDAIFAKLTFKVPCVDELVNAMFSTSGFYHTTEKTIILQKLRLLQRYLVLTSFYIKLLDSFDDYSGANLSGMRKVMIKCRNEYPDSINLLYLKTLHMEIIEIPTYLKKRKILATLRTLDNVLSAEIDIAFDWSQPEALQSENLKRFMRNLRVGADASTSPMAFKTQKRMFNEFRRQEKRINQKRELSEHYDFRVPNQGPNDLYFRYQWALLNESPASLNLVDVWSNLSTFNNFKPVVVAVIDTGLDLTHEDLVDKLWINEDEVLDNGIDDDENGYIDDKHGWDFAANHSRPEDFSGHGTKVAGIIAASSGNRIGVASICPFCKIMTLKTTYISSEGKLTTSGGLFIMILTDVRTSLSWIQAIDYALRKNVKICNFSSAGPKLGAIDVALWRARRSNMIIVVSAGNSGLNVDRTENRQYPAASPFSNIVSVASVNKDGELSEFSNFGASTITLGAPGKNIWTTTKGDEYARVSGTSFATPHVSALIAWLQGLYPEVNHREIIEKLIQHGNVLPQLQGKTRTGVAVSFNNIYLDFWLRVACEVQPPFFSEGCSLGTESSKLTTREDLLIR